METVAIGVGCWVQTERWGPAVVTSISKDYISIRYEATRRHDQKTIWVLHRENPWECQFLREADAVSKHVLKLVGPYGVSVEGQVCPACNQVIEGAVREWEGQTVHRICPGIDYSVLTDNRYHAHIFWNETVPWGIYRSTIPWEQVVEQARAHGKWASRTIQGWGEFKPDEFMALDKDPEAEGWV